MRFAYCALRLVAEFIVLAAEVLKLPPGLFFRYTIFMGKAITRTRKSRGRPPTGAESVHLRVLPEQRTAVDLWISRQKEAGLSRPEAIRRLINLGLTVKQKRKQGSAAGAARAKELAAKAIDKMSDGGASPDDQAHRKRRLLKGPEEFRDARVDRAKTKP